MEYQIRDATSGRLLETFKSELEVKGFVDDRNPGRLEVWTVDELTRRVKNITLGHKVAGKG